MKTKTKKKIIKLADSLSQDAVRRLDLLKAFVNLIAITVFILIFFLGFQGVLLEDITGFFNIFLTFAILFIMSVLMLFLIRSNLHNGFLGYSNAFYLVCGILFGVSGSSPYIEVADIIVTSVYLITFCSMIYIYCKKHKKKIMKFVKKHFIKK